jgi:hypothetical protein
MLTINLFTDKAHVAPACKRHGKLYSEAFYLYAAENRGELLAEGLFEVKSELAQISAYSGPEDDPALFDGILRAGLNYAGEQGIEKGSIPEDFRYQRRGMFRKLNYPVATTFNIVNFFQKYKNCVVP